MKSISVYTILAIAVMLLVAVPASAEDFTDDNAGYSITFDENTWTVEDIGMMFGDMSSYDDKLVSTPLMLVDYDSDMAGVFVIASRQEGDEKNFIGFITENMGDTEISTILEKDDTFTDASGDPFESKVKSLGVTPEFEDEGILITQTFNVNGIRYEIGFLALPGNFKDLYKQAVEIMNSIDIKM